MVARTQSERREVIAVVVVPVAVADETTPATSAAVRGQREVKIPFRH